MMSSRERPIIFSGPMVRAILDGSKTQTRRIVKNSGDMEFDNNDPYFGPYWLSYATEAEGEDAKVRCPYGIPGDRLWVRETWALERDGTGCPDDTGILYRATDPGWDDEDTGLRWRPSIHMPRTASRILLEVTDVRVQGLKDISEDDARAEGYSPRSPDYPVGWFHGLWDTINGAGAWHQNPWVWAITFRRLQP